MNNFLEISKQQEITETKRFFVRVYGWMSLALIITGLTAFKTATSPEIIEFCKHLVHTCGFSFMNEFGSQRQ